jgi:hypothetical protein
LRWNEEPLELADLCPLIIAFTAYFNGYLDVEAGLDLKIISLINITR